MKRIFSNKYLNYVLILIFGLFLGWLIFHPKHKHEAKNEAIKEVSQETIWTCAMHPHIRMSQPGKCPICGMDLIPLAQGSITSIDPDAVHFTPEAAQLANVLTSAVSKQTPVKEVRLYGKVEADERLLQSQVAHIPGRIESLNVNFTGERVIVGQTLGQIYSPELITAQQELLEAAKTKENQRAIYEAAKEKLRQWKLTDNQIFEIEASGEINNTINIVSNTSGVITSRRVNKGDYVSQGTVLFDIADLSKVWIMFDAYESDLQFIKNDEKISFTLQALPGENYTGKILFIDPVIDPVTRVAKVRVETDNRQGKLKPGMFATGNITAVLAGYKGNLVVPRSSVLWTGKRSIVYVKESGFSDPVFKMREIELGPMLGESYVVTDGLMEGEEIVTKGTFSVDAAAQLEGKPSMMNRQSGKINTKPGMNMAGNQEKNMNAVQQNTQPAGKSMDNMTNMPAQNISMDFIMQLNTVFDHYIALKNALVNSDASQAKDASVKVKEALGNVDAKLLSGDNHMKYMDILNILSKNTDAIISSESIDVQRAAFSELSDQIYKAIKTFGLMGKTVYYQFCPMYNDGKGAYWLSEAKEIRNPYYGMKMIDCGETKETLISK
ncbi:MAG TPA: efflux RND transporter periplasmic adaptor subunit [Bacteroidales bacterium]|nr:efflux RND transporter periplasmic adaptor subunit [Bacteroidales bacterium]HPT21655.1 efflux RND transporter periplasmic adaptor subunit [Bacteroidales bacterium]